MNNYRSTYAVAAALVAGLALAGCKKAEEAATTPSIAPAPIETPAPATSEPVAVSTVAIGNAATADKSVIPLTTLAPTDKIYVSVKTDASTPANATLEAKLGFVNGTETIEAGSQSATIAAGGADTTNLIFSKATPWPVGTYKIDVTLNGAPVGSTQEVEVK